MATPKITRIEVESFTWDVKGLTHQRAFHYDPDSTLTFHASGIKNMPVGARARRPWWVQPEAISG